MRAVTIPRFGDADVLTLTDVPTPMPGPGEVAIDVAFAGANYAEILYRRGAADAGLCVGQPVAALTIVPDRPCAVPSMPCSPAGSRLTSATSCP